MESFESYASLDASNGLWNVTNIGDNNTFEIVEGVGHTGNKSVRILNIGQPAGSIDELSSGSFDLSGLNSSDDLTLTFRHSFKQRSSSNDDRLRILASNSCGESWATRRQILSASLSVGTQASSWTPESQEDWITTHVTNITSSYFVDGMRIKFEWTNGGGNNLFLDDINLYLGSNDPLSIGENVDLISDIVLFPNPSIDELTIRLSMQESSDLEIRVLDLSGKEINTYAIQGQTGINDVLVNTSNLSKGMYLVEIYSNGMKQVKQFVKN
jgi:hypothetical protein